MKNIATKHAVNVTKIKELALEGLMKTEISKKRSVGRATCLSCISKFREIRWSCYFPNKGLPFEVEQ